MFTFKDSEGREYSAKVCCSAIDRVKAGAELDLLDLDSPVIEQMTTNPAKAIAALWYLLPEDKRVVSWDEFRDSFAGEVLEKATDAFMEDWTNFFHRPVIRDALKTMRTKFAELIQRSMTNALTRVEAEIESKLGGSTPTASPVPAE